MQPYWADFNTSGGSEFGDYLAKRGDEVSAGPALGDRRPCGGLRRPTIVRAYNSVRGGAAKHIEAALPRVGDLVLKYAS